MAKYVGAIDQGTTSSRFILFDHKGQIKASHQMKLPNIFPQPGWQEQCPNEILSTVKECVETVMSSHVPSEVAAVGITNQRETLVVWDRETGEPLHNAIVWCDTRTDGLVHRLVTKFGDKMPFQAKTGLPVSTYFTALKLKWVMEEVPVVKQAIEANRAMVGTIDSWLVYKLAGKHVTDVSNASRTMLMNLKTLAWDPEICQELDIPMSILPEIRSSSEIYGHIQSGKLSGIPLSGCLGDQQAALLGQKCLSIGDTKNTYGTGCFLLMNTGDKPVISSHGLLTTVAFKLGANKPCQYALEGSVAVSGAALTWLQDSLGLVACPQEVTALAESVPDAGGVMFVPAFSGLLAPYWREDARGMMIGITRYVNKAHICRATLEASAYQTADVIEAMQKDASITLNSLKVDGGLSRSDLLCSFQADLLGVPVYRPIMDERTALGAAYAAGLAEGVEFWSSTEALGETEDGKEGVSVGSVGAEATDAKVDAGSVVNGGNACTISSVASPAPVGEFETFAVHALTGDRAKMRRRWSRAVERAIGWGDDEGDEGGE